MTLHTGTEQGLSRLTVETVKTTKYYFPLSLIHRDTEVAEAWLPCFDLAAKTTQHFLGTA